jgi:hypothetical protein
MENRSAVRTVYDYPVAGHICRDGAVHYVRLVRQAGQTQPQGYCPQCQLAFQYQKPQRSRVKHYDGAGATHF